MDTNQSSTRPPSSWAFAAAKAMMAMLALAFIYANLAACSKQEAPQSAADLSRFAHGGMARLAIMDDAPAMSAQILRDAAGVETDLATLTHGQVSVVNLWATFCAPCKTEMPTLGALQRRFGGALRASSSADMRERCVRLMSNAGRVGA